MANGNEGAVQREVPLRVESIDGPESNGSGSALATLPLAPAQMAHMCDRMYMPAEAHMLRGSPGGPWQPTLINKGKAFLKASPSTGQILGYTLGTLATGVVVTEGVKYGMHQAGHDTDFCFLGIGIKYKTRAEILNGNVGGSGTVRPIRSSTTAATSR